MFGEGDGFAGEVEEFLFSGGAAWVEDFGGVPVVVGCWGDEVAVHGPVVVLAKGDPPTPDGYSATRAVGGVVVVGRNVVRRGQAIVDQVERREQEQRFVRAFMRRALPHRRNAGVEIVKAFDGGIEFQAGCFKFQAGEARTREDGRMALEVEEKVRGKLFWAGRLA